MRTSTPLPRALARLGALLAAALSVGAVGLPAAHATDTTVRLTLGAGQSASIGTVVTNANVTPVPTCDPELSVSFDAAMAGTVTVAPSATVGSYTCSVDYQISGQSTGLIEHVLVDVVPGLSISDLSMHEGDTGIKPLVVAAFGDGSPTPFNFTVTLSEPSASTVTVAVATANGTAVAPSDYAAVDTTVTFPPGQTSETVTVPVVPDDSRESDETFTVNLSAPTGAVIVDGQGNCTILNDDLGPVT